MEYQTLILEKKDGIATITFNRPEAMNASNLQSSLDFMEATMDIEADDSIKAAIIWGGPKFFCAGGDIKYFCNASPLEMESFIARCHATHDRIANSSKPYIAAVAGLALGGGLETVLSCDIKIAADNAVMGLPEINIGIIPGAGGTQRLPRAVGSNWARHLILTGEMIDAETALKIGLVCKVVPVDQLYETAEKYARSLARKSPTAVRSAKKCIEYSEKCDLATGLAYEQKAWAFLYTTEDQTEGMKAFLEKRKPNYTGK